MHFQASGDLPALRDLIYPTDLWIPWRGPFAYETANPLAGLRTGDNGLFERRLRSVDADHAVVDLNGINQPAQIGLAEWDVASSSAPNRDAACDRLAAADWLQVYGANTIPYARPARSSGSSGRNVSH